MDSHSSTQRAADAAERLVRAQFGALPDQLHRAVLTHPFALPEAKALVSQADRIAAAAVAATAALSNPADGPTAFQALSAALAPGCAIYAALRDEVAQLIANKTQKFSKSYTEECTADCEILLDALSNFQVRARPDDYSTET